MATLMKIHISGIRSFGPYEEHAQQLKFDAPVTLILGQNGCGKTTILESLKFACSGDLPGGTNSGQGFVNDPKMSSASRTKGHIKLKLLDSRNNEITVSRVVEVALTEKSMNFKSKNSTIRKVTPNGEDSSISGREKDVSNEICQLMNVSPAVLNNVVFCHQENSLWPLDEGKKLKEKFDEIFDAQKYNKCTELFLKDLKAKESGIKLLEHQLSYTKEKKEGAEKMNRTLQDKENRLEGFEADMKTKDTELTTVKTRMDEIFALEHDLADLEKELTTKKERKNGAVEEQNTIKKNLPFEFEGTDQELGATIDSFAHERQREENLIAELETRKTGIENKNRVVGEAIQQAQTQLGKLKEQKNQYENKCTERLNLFEKSKQAMELRDLKDFETTDGARAALYRLSTEVEDQEFCLATLISEKEEEHKGLQNVIDRARETTVTTTQNILSKEREVKECEKKVEQISGELLTISSSDSLLGDIQKNIEKLDRTVYNLNNNFKEAEESKNVESYKKQIVGIESELESLDGEYRILQQNDVVEGQMESEKRLIMQKQKEINRIKMKHSDNLKELFNGTIPERNLKDQVLSKQRNADSTVRNLRDEITTKQKEVTTLEVQRNHQLEKISSCEKELRVSRNKISQACSGRDFNETLRNTFEKKERLQIDKGQYSSVRIIYGQFVKKFEEASPCCPVCESDFSHKGGVVAKIIASLKSKVDKVPEQLRKVENDLEKEEALYTKLQQLKFVHEEIESIETEKLPKLKQDLDEMEQKLNEDKEQLVQLEVRLNQPQRIGEIAGKVVSDVGSLDQNLSDVEKSQRTVENLKQTLVEVASKKSKQEVEAQIDRKKFEVAELRGKVDTITKNINNHKDRIQQLGLERKEMVEKQTRMKETLQNRPLLMAQKEELSEKATTLRDDIDKLKSRLNGERDDLKHAVNDKEARIRKSKEEEVRQREKISGYSKIVQELDKLQREIEDYLRDDIDAKLITTEDKLKECRNKEETLEITKMKIIDTISQKREDLAKEELRLRTLKSNVILREKKRVEAKLEAEIQDLRGRIGGYNYRTVYEEKRRLEVRRENLEKQINNISGEKNGLLESIQEIRQELNKPENKKAYTNYISKLYELKIRKVVINDIKNFVNALEKAVLAFHTSKMVQINRTVRSLWRNTYRGNDIDHIEIKAEFASGNAKRRAYNYKVVQIKKGIELDMRGRCSAGQKVLACLLIRMALAETLSSNCGILALDEPTTNLDRANVLSLSDTLARIIGERRDEKSFQLVVITHDEEFLTALTRAQGVHFYYKVLRDKDGYSQIKREAVL